MNILIFFFLFLKALSLEVKVDNPFPAPGESFSLNVSSKEAFEVKGLENFYELSKQKQSSITVVNGRMNVDDREIYILAPKNEGVFSIEVSTKDESKKVEIKVKESLIAPQSMIKIHGHEKQVYKGEKILLGYDFLSKREIAVAKFREIVSDEFDIKQFKSDGEGAGQESIGLERYNKWNIDRLIVSAKKAGKLTFPKRTLDLEILNTRSFHGQFIPMHLDSESLEIEVLDLEEDAIVGKPKMTYEFSTGNINQDETITLIVSFSGKANLDNLNSLYSDLDDFKVFEHITEFKESVDKEYFADKKFEIIFSPKKSGILTIPEVKLLTFNLSSKKYEHLIIKQQSIKVSSKGGIEILIDKTSISLNKYLVVVILFLLLLFLSIYFRIFSKLFLIKKINDVYESDNEEEIIRIFYDFLKEHNLASAALIKDKLQGKVGEKLLKIFTYIEQRKIFGTNEKRLNLKKEIIELMKELNKNKSKEK